MGLGEQIRSRLMWARTMLPGWVAKGIDIFKRVESLKILGRLIEKTVNLGSETTGGKVIIIGMASLGITFISTTVFCGLTESMLLEFGIFLLAFAIMGLLKDYFSFKYGRSIKPEIRYMHAA